MTNSPRTAAASKARHLNALRRKAPAMVEALRELGYTVTEPECGAVFPGGPGQDPCRKPPNHATEAPSTDWKRDYHSNGLLKWRVDGADLPSGGAS